MQGLSTGDVFTRTVIRKEYFIAALSANHGYDIVIMVEGEFKFFMITVPTVPISTEVLKYVDDIRFLRH